MASQNALRDQNQVPTLIGESSTVSGEKTRIKVNPSTGAILTDVTAIVPGTGATSLGKAVDSVAGATDTGVAALAVRDDALTTLTPIDGDYTNLRTNANGALWVDLASLLSGESQSEGGLAMFRKFSPNTTYTVTRDISAALEASTIAKNSPGCFLATEGRIDASAPSGTYYVHWYDSATLPANGSVTMLRHPLRIDHVTGTNSYFSWVADTLNGAPGLAGLVLCLSSTEFTKTISGAYLSATNYVI